MRTDAQMKQDVLAELKWEAEVDESKIGVIVSNGAVTLAGFVPTYRQKIAAARAAKGVAGVLAVVNNIDVRLESARQMTDEGLAERIANVLKWNVSAPSQPIKAEVSNGIVTLTGEVEWQYQRTNITKNVEHVGGVVNVINLITVKSRVATADVKDRIKEALRRHADVEADRISISVSDGTVTLSGTVDSIAEMDLVEHTAWQAPGVSKVVDNLHVR
jgi:osmotically-inducible protein OsmY